MKPKKDFVRGREEKNKKDEMKQFLDDVVNKKIIEDGDNIVLEKMKQRTIEIISE